MIVSFIIIPCLSQGRNGPDHYTVPAVFPFLLSVLRRWIHIRVDRKGCGAVYAAAEGTVKDIEASTDPTFANKVLGDGVVIFPEDGTVMAPCKATVSLVYPTGHAIGLTTADGAEILIHCGVDTVNMNGEGFETLVKEGQEVTAEEALIRFDIDLVKKHGYSPEILVIFTELPEGKTIKTEEKHIAKNDKMAEIV